MEGKAKSGHVQYVRGGVGVLDMERIEEDNWVRKVMILYVF